jgi:alkylmercury lyase
LSVEKALELGRAGRDTEGQVVELSGLMLSPTMHRVEIGDIALFSCCALLAQLVPALIGRPVRVDSVDPVSRRLVVLDISPEGVTAVEPLEAVGSFVVTELSGVAQDVGANFCRHVHHFASPDSASVFAAADCRRYTLGIDQLHAAARMLYREAWAG